MYFGVVVGLILMIGIALPENVWADSGQKLVNGSGETMIAEGCYFDENSGKLRITEEFKWDTIIQLSYIMEWDINGLEPEEVITVEIDLTGTRLFLENEDEIEKDFGHHICFRDFTNLETISFTGNIDARLKIDLFAMFEGCSKLKIIDFSGFSGANVIGMWSMFADCSSLTSLDLSSFDTSNVTSMIGMFQKCNSLKELDISNFDFGKIEIDSDSILGLFYRMDNVEQIKVPANLPYAIEIPYSHTIPDTMESYWINTSGKECTEIQPGLSTPMTYFRKLRTASGNSTTQQSQKTPLAKGKTFTDSKTKYKYKVISSPAEKPTAAFIGTTKKSKKITIPSDVTYQGITYQVTSISAKALKGIHKKCKIKVPFSKLKDYQKLFRKKGQNSAVKITK